MAKQLAEDERVIRFAAVAKRFCRLVEGRSKLKKREFIHRCAEIVAELQLLSLQLVRIRMRFACCDDYKSVPPKKWKAIRDGLERKFGKDDLYHFVYNPYQPEEDQSRRITISDDLADIYCDLRPGLDIFRKGEDESIRAAVCHWKMRWLTLTGHHYASALRPLQVLVETSYGIVQ